MTGRACEGDATASPGLTDAGRPGRRPRWRPHVLALLGFALVAIGFSWPLPAHFSTYLTGPPSSDMGVYVWNLWVFQHEILDHHQYPLFTSAVLSLGAPADLSLHNYTIFADILALPLVRLIGLIATFNALFLAISVMTAYTMFLLARDIVRSDVEAWLAGLVLAFSPALVARSTGHLSLVAAAPLPLFLLLLLHAERRGRPATMAGAGATLAWAAYCDPYYGVYCVVLGAWHLGARSLEFRRDTTEPGRWNRRARRVLDGAIAIVALLAAVIAVTGGGRVHVLGQTISATGLYTPVLLLTVLAVARALIAVRPRVGIRLSPEAFRLLKLAPWGMLASAVLLSPMLYALAVRVSEGRFVAPRIFWRTSTPGVDLAALFMPNPNHPLINPLVHGWLAAQNGGYIENVASLTLVVLSVLAVAVWVYRVRLPWYWSGLALTAATLALGPFVRIAGLHTYIPTPWALLRYAPVIGSARAPARFMVIVMMGAAVLFAVALRSIGQAHPRHRRVILAGVGTSLLLGLWPVPRPLYSARIPAIYEQIAQDSRDVRVLEIPFGVRDGLTGAGDFNTTSLLFQTRHGKSLMGGYLSRVSSQRVESIRARPVLKALMLLSEGRRVPPFLAQLAASHAPGFVERARLGYVVIDKTRASPEIVAFATRVLNLERIAGGATRDLYRPRPPGDPRWLSARLENPLPPAR